MCKKLRMLSVLVTAAFLCSGCSEILNASIGSQTEAYEEAPTVYENGSLYEITKYDQKTGGDSPLEIDLETPEASEDSWSFQNGCLTILKPGDYILSGKLSPGNLTVRVYDDEIVHLILNNAEINSRSGPAIYIQQAGKVILTAAEGTINTLSDSSSYPENNRACIFCNSDLTINGSGALSVFGYYHDAIRSKDCLKILNINLQVRSKNNGLRGNDGVLLLNSNTDIESESSGIVANAEKDFIEIQGGTCKIIAGEHALSSNRCILIQNSQIDLYSIQETLKCNGIIETDEDISP